MPPIMLATPAEVKSAFLPFASLLPSADAVRERLEADYRAYGDWLDANADDLAAEAEDYERYESGAWAF